MLLGKRSRHPMKRTTSMTGITVDVSNVDGDDDAQQPSKIMSDPHPNHNPLHEFPDTSFAGYDPRFLAMVSPRNISTATATAAAAGRSASSSTSTNHNHHLVVDSTAPFLRSCGLCNRRLAPGRDIYMYMGDAAFCSLECREQQMKQDERKEKLNNVVAASNKERHGHASSTSNSKPSTKTESAAAA